MVSVLDDVVGSVLDAVTPGWAVTATAVVIAVAVAVVGVREAVERWRHRWARAGAQIVQILAPPHVDPAGGPAFWQHLLGLLPPRRRARWLSGPHVVFEYRFGPDGLAVAVWVPATVPAALVAAAARSAWPGCHTAITDPDTTPPDPGPGPSAGSGSGVAGGRLRLARPQRLPLGTDHTLDPLRALIGAAGGLGVGQSAQVQILARPVSAARLAALTRRAWSGAMAGAPTPAAAAARLLGVVASASAVAAAGVLQEAISLAVGGTTPRHGPQRGRAARPELRAGDRPGRLVETAQDRAVAAKAHDSSGAYTVEVRYLTRSHGGPVGRQRADATGRAHAIGSAFAALGGGHNHLRRRPLAGPHSRLAGSRGGRGGPASVMADRRLRRGDLLSVPELAALAHLPTDPHVPGLRRAGAAAVAPPPAVARGGAGVRPLGDSDAITGRTVGIAIPDARHHTWIVGATGSGKSALAVHGVLADAAAGRAAVVLDPKGDLVTDILARLPDAARARTVLIDPHLPDRPGPAGQLPGWPCLNPLAPLTGSADGAGGSGRVVGDVVTDHVVGVFSRVFASAWGPRTEDVMRVACMTLRAAGGTPTLADVATLLTDPDTRRELLTPGDGESPDRPDDGHGDRDDDGRTDGWLGDRPDGRLGGGADAGLGRRLREFWSWFEQLSDPARAQVTAPLLNKLRSVLLRPFAEQLLCGPSTVDLPRLLDSGGLLLVRLPKGQLGEDATRLIGSLIVAQVWQAALTRATQPEHARRDASLVLDECQNFLHLPTRIEDMLAEARGYRLGMTLAHQHLAQLSPELRDGIATNARNKLVFSVSPEDAARLARHTEPELDAHDLANLGRFHTAARLLTDGAESPAFTLTTRALPPATTPVARTDPPGPGQPRRAGPRPAPPRPAPRRPDPRRST